MTHEEFFSRYSYDVVADRIGIGGFGTVYKAYDNLLHREVAVKVSEVKCTIDGHRSFSLKDEFEALSHVPKHRNIANYEELYSFRTPYGIFDYAVMQYYPDGNLDDVIKEGLTDEQKEEVAMQLLEGIDFLHKHKVVHRDLKPANILIVKHGGSVIPLITDFGLSKAANTGDGSMFSNSFGGGTKRYSSPEQLQGKPLRFNTDLWSYGTIVYELFMGEHLFNASSGASNSAQAELEVYNKIIHGDVSNLSKMPDRWRKVAERCMVVDPEQRVKSAEELLYLLKGYEEATMVEGMTELPTNNPPQMPETPQVSEPPQTSKPPQVPKPPLVPKPSKVEIPSDDGKKGKGLWIGLLLAVVAASVWLYLLRDRVAEEANYWKCRTANDYREYVTHYGTNGRHYNDAKQFIDKYVIDSLYRSGQEADRVEYEAFCQCTTLEACYNYLNSYPNGQYVDQVKTKIDGFKDQQAEYEAFMNCNTIADCNNYLNKYPNGQYVEQVKAKKDDLQANENEEEAYRNCTSIEGCNYYLNQYPNGKYVEQVNEKLSVYKAKLRAEEERKEREKEDDAYRRCITIDGCNRYLRDYPEGRYVADVKNKKANLEAEIEKKKKDQEIRNSVVSKTFTANGVEFVMKKIDGGSFTMGATPEQGNDAREGEKPAHTVTLNTYYIGETEVTQALWVAVMGYEPTNNGGWTDAQGRGSNYPAYRVSWDDIQIFLERLNSYTGRNFRLPTEAEWEFAARGRKSNNCYKYAGSNEISRVAWYNDNSKLKTHPVKGKDSNELGLYDMSGNVWEWCNDWKVDYTNGSQYNPKGPKYGNFRVLRGGSWGSNAGNCRVSNRNRNSPDKREIDYGFRLCLTM